MVGLFNASPLTFSIFILHPSTNKAENIGASHGRKIPIFNQLLLLPFTHALRDAWVTAFLADQTRDEML